MKIVFFNRFFYPDSSATSQILSDLAFHLADNGGEVHVVTSQVPGAFSAFETIRGVAIHRVARALVGPHGLGRRALAYASYYRGARRAARRILGDGDIAVFKTDPPLLSSAVGGVAAQQGARVVVWVQDVFPEIAREFGVPGMRGPLFRWLQRLRNDSLRRALRVIVIGERMASRLICEGIDPNRVRVIHNWADANAIVPIRPEASPLRERWHLQSKFVVAYSGNLGRVHEFHTILGAAKLLSERHDVVFTIIGHGPRLAEVQSEVLRARLSNVMFQPHQDRANLQESLGLADVHLSVLEARFDALVLPSKLYGIMAAGRPVIFIGDPAGESATLIEKARCGVAIRTDDAAGLARTITRLAGDTTERERMGLRGRSEFEKEYTLRKALAKWQTALEEIGYGSS